MPPKQSDKYVAVLDACVLWPASLRDTLLRLAETPRQYSPKWSREIWSEVTRNLESRRGLSPAQISHLVERVYEHFPEAMVSGYAKMTATMTNHPKDRHVLAAAAKCQAQFIVTSNLKDFPAQSLANRGIEAIHPDEFLVRLYELDSVTVLAKLRDQAATIGRDLSQVLTTLRTGVPNFASRVAGDIGSEIASGA